MSKSSQQGFVLLAVLGMIMLLSLVAAFIAGYAEQRINQAQAQRLHWQQQLNTQATLASLQFMLASRGRVNGGWQLNSEQRLRLDGSPYRGVGDTVFSLQDEGPLLSLLVPDRERWQQLLQREGLTASEAEQLLDQLQDYTDQDDLRRLNGATRQDYLQAGLEPPPHRLMTSPGQLFNLLSASHWQPLLHRLLPLVTARSGQLYNLNTAPEQVLLTLPGSEPELWQQLVAERENGPFTDLADANRRLGQLLPLDPLAVPQIPSNFMRLQLWPNGAECRQARWIGITLTPTSIRAPWEIDYVFDYRHPQPCRAPAALAAGPLAR